MLNQTRDHRQRVLVSVAKELQNWSIMVSKMKAIYYTLNHFNMDVTKKCLIGECWVPCEDIPTVQKALADGSVSYIVQVACICYNVKISVFLRMLACSTYVFSKKYFILISKFLLKNSNSLYNN